MGQSQSQRDCVLQPRVASRELPWEKRPLTINPNGVASVWWGMRATTPLGLRFIFASNPG